MLDELRQSMPAPQDNTELFERLNHIETLLQALINSQQGTSRREPQDWREDVEETQTIHVTNTSNQTWGRNVPRGARGFRNRC